MSSRPRAPKRPDPCYREEAIRKAARKDELRKAEIEVLNLPEELKCSFVHDLGGFKVPCAERGTDACAKCSNILCVAHIKSSVTTHAAKPVVSKGRKEPAVEHQSHYCFECATGPDGKIIGTVNKSFNDSGSYTCE